MTPFFSKHRATALMDPIVRAFNLALGGNASELSSMLTEGAVSASGCRADGMYKSWSLLHAAASKGHLTVVECLVNAGADVGTLNAKGQTPAQLASSKGHATVAMRLEAVASDTKADAPSDAKATALERDTERDFDELIERLVISSHDRPAELLHVGVGAGAPPQGLLFG